MDEHVIYQSPKTMPKSQRVQPFRKRQAAHSALAGFRLTSRDLEIIRAVYEYRVLSTDQVERLLFSPQHTEGHTLKPTRCQYRLKLLFGSGYLTRKEQLQKPSEGRKPFLYLLAGKGARLLAEHLTISRDQLDWKAKGNRILPLFLEHLIATNDIRVAFAVAASRQSFVIEKWLDERTLKRQENRDYVILPGSMRNGFSSKRVPVLPDGYFVLRGGGKRGHFFLEVDRGTEPGSRFADKVLVYLTYVETGQYQKRFGTNSLRVLTVTTGSKRLENLRAAARKEGGSEMLLFTTYERVSGTSVLTESIWETVSGNLRALL